VLFGGFGGSSSDGKYLSDVWTFSTSTCTWTPLRTGGQIPESRSNYSLHYNSQADQIILYGGGSNNKTRYNSVCILDWQTKQWTQYLPEESSQAPWERTYHSSEFCYPYLMVHGGEGVSNIDFDDMWVFNVVDKTWRDLSFDPSGAHPKKRRFHATALVGSHFYVLGGCTGNYQLLGDIHRVDLSRLFEENAFSDFSWECVNRKSKQLERWGHSSNVYHDKIYLSCGRISANSDSNDTYCFDPAHNSLTLLEVDGDVPIPRRRHASIIVGNSLLLFGGYNGKYLNDFHYLALNTVANFQSIDYERLTVDGSDKLEQKLCELEKKFECDYAIEVTSNHQAVYTVRTNIKKLSGN
jgi:hypothetical protein